MSRLRIIFRSVVILGILALIGLGVWKAWQGKLVLRSDPATLRDDKAYKKLVGPPQRFVATNLPPISGIILTTNGSQIQVTYPVPPEQEPSLFNYTVERLSPGQTVTIQGKRVSLKYLGISYGIIPTNLWNQYNFRKTGHYYHSDFTEIPRADLQLAIPSQWNREIDFRGRFPQVRFVLGPEIIGSAKFLDIKIVDARTKKILTRGYGITVSPDVGFNIDAEMLMWHSAPIEVIIDLAFGPVETFQLKPVVGARLTHPQGEVEVLAVALGDSLSWSMNNGNGTNMISLNFNSTNATNGAMVVLSSRPQASSLPIDFAFIDQHGKVMPSNISGSSGNAIMMGLGGSFSDLDFIKATYYPKSVRLICSLPSMPGLPAANKDVSNLFDVQIPFVLLKTDYEMEQFLRDVLQLEIVQNHIRTVPPGFFPRSYEHVTPRIILNDYLKCYAEPYSVRINPKKQTLELQSSFVKRTWERFQKWIKGL
ncbi:MAG: hypothetical protein JWN25_297 [Verrucomicrobiales bacterium]|nr:hypothetical protein [Verrucomicrobiales bacterium]